MTDVVSGTQSYQELLTRLKSQIQTSQVRAAVAVNQELVLLYWGIGNEILQRQREEGWGAKVIERLADDLRLEFPDMQGLSARNLKYMRTFAEAWPIVQQPVAQLPWGHNVRLLDLVKAPEERLWYAHQAVQHGWSRNVLVLQIEGELYHRQGRATTNFQTTLPAAQSDLAQQILKDPYNFDFLTLSGDVKEKDLERELLAHLRQFLIELGVGFAFMGSQVALEIGGEEYKIDLLFYHVKLRAYVVIDLKMGAFKPEYAGKRNFYLSAADDLLRHPDDQPSIGLILCKSKNRIVAEYSLRNMSTPMSISAFKQLPSVEELQALLSSGG
jgi:predicted nuclease of restriction endonuclease-like (RecB) superfamily